jgi:S-formylglutathione hydrolase FrmB
MKQYRMAILCCLFAIQALAGTVDTVSYESASMKKTFRCVVVKPNSYDEQKTFPVVYLLHGYGGGYANWIKRVPDIVAHADRLNILIVCPDGGISSWYLNSPIDQQHQYETMVGIELVAMIDQRYKTIANRKARAITGLSMGGHGAMLLAWKHADIFGAAGSMSGALDIQKIGYRFELEKRLGDTIQHASQWQQNCVFKLVEQAPKDSLALMIDCGVSDFLIGVNRALHEKMVQLKIAHDYIERPGAHDWGYWRNAVIYQLTFFDQFFAQQNTKKP